jgi:hypothetical protein
MKLFVASAVLCLSAFPALADKPAYCEAYARDFADRSADGVAGWDHKFKIAKAACLEAGGLPATASAPAPAPAAPAKTQQAAIVAAPVVAAPAAVKADHGVDKASALQPGSQAWNDYCAQKYSSFDADSGLYLSRTGVKRHCLVTKDFPVNAK